MCEDYIQRSHYASNQLIDFSHVGETLWLGRFFVKGFHNIQMEGESWVISNGYARVMSQDDYAASASNVSLLQGRQTFTRMFPNGRIQLKPKTSSLNITLVIVLLQL